MKKSKLFARLTVQLALMLVVASTCLAQSAPEVIKVEPPNWWPGHSINPVRVMIRGQNMKGAQVTAVGAGLSIRGPAKVNERGTYLFVDVVIAPAARPGPRRLRITIESGLMATWPSRSNRANVAVTH